MADNNGRLEPKSIGRRENILKSIVMRGKKKRNRDERSVK